MTLKSLERMGTENLTLSVSSFPEQDFVWVAMDTCLL